MYLYMVLLGCKPMGRLTEQHDIFFGIAENLRDLIPDIELFWPEGRNKIHIDAWRRVTLVDNYQISIIPRISVLPHEKHLNLYFLNLGGYLPNEFEEFHHKVLLVANSMDEAKKLARSSAFFKKQQQYKNQLSSIAVPHIDDKYGVDVDDAFNVEDILSKKFTEKFEIILVDVKNTSSDEIHLGYHKLNEL